MSSRVQPTIARQETTVEIRVHGRVQGVGFRPTVWRLASEIGLDGEVLNDGDGVLIRVGGTEAGIDALLRRLEREPPPLARIDRIESQLFAGALPSGFPHRRQHRRRCRTPRSRPTRRFAPLAPPK